MAKQTFTKQHAIDAGVDPGVFDTMLGDIYAEAKTGEYGITSKALLEYIQFLDLDQSERLLSQAKADATAATASASDARTLAIAALGVSSLLALGSIGLQVGGTTRLASEQLTAITARGDSIITLVTESNLSAKASKEELGRVAKRLEECLCKPTSIQDGQWNALVAEWKRPVGIETAQFEALVTELRKPMAIEKTQLEALVAEIKKVHTNKIGQ